MTQYSLWEAAFVPWLCHFSTSFYRREHRGSYFNPWVIKHPSAYSCLTPKWWEGYIILSHSPKEEKADLCEPWKPLPLHNRFFYFVCFLGISVYYLTQLFTILLRISLELSSYYLVCLASRTAWNWYVLKGGFVFSTSSHFYIPPHILTPQDKPVSEVGS